MNLSSQQQRDCYLSYYRYCQRAQFMGFQPLKFPTFASLWKAGLDFTYSPLGEKI